MTFATCDCSNATLSQLGAIQVMFYVSKSAVEAAQQKFATYQEHFPGWAAESSGMSQYAGKSRQEQEREATFTSRF